MTATIVTIEEVSKCLYPNWQERLELKERLGGVNITPRSPNILFHDEISGLFNIPHCRIYLDSRGFLRVHPNYFCIGKEG